MMRSFDGRRQCLCAAMFALLAVSVGFVAVSTPAANAQGLCSYSQDFDGFADGATDLGDGSVIVGSAAVSLGVLVLTRDGSTSDQSSFSVPAMVGSSDGWTATFDIAIFDEAGGGAPADGFSFNYGNAALGELGNFEFGMRFVDEVTENVAYIIDTFGADRGVKIGAKTQGLHQILASTVGDILTDGSIVEGTATVTYDPLFGLSFMTTGFDTNANFEFFPTSFVGDDAYTFILSARTGQFDQTLVIDDLEIDCGAPRRYCAGLLVTIDMNVNGANGTGTTGDDVILGTPGPDTIDGKEGSDTVCGEGGDDMIDGGVGDFRDFLYGGPGDDTMFGGFGIDYIYGEAGEDTLDGQGGSDRLFGGPDNDLIKGDSGADRMYGGPGDDEMRGMGGQDFMWGEAGNDLMQGNFQTDNMFGGPGDDTMFGAGGKDSLFGEAGNDALSGGNNTDYLDGGDDVDTANGGKGRDKPLTPPQVRASNGQFFGGSGCIAETIQNCQPTP